MDNTEHEIKDFLKRIISSLVLGLCWLMINMTLGIYFNLLFFRDRPRPFNWVYYAFLVFTLLLYLNFLRRTWKKRFPHG